MIDALIVTHPHTDHSPGALAVLRHFEVREYYDPGFPSTLDTYKNFRHAVDAESAEGRPIVQHVGRGSFGTPDRGSELKVEWLWAWPGSAEGLGSDNDLVNNASIVFRLVYGTQSVLFMGDAEEGTDQVVIVSSGRHSLCGTFLRHLSAGPRNSRAHLRP